MLIAKQLPNFGSGIALNFGAAVGIWRTSVPEPPMGGLLLPADRKPRLMETPGATATSHTGSRARGPSVTPVPLPGSSCQPLRGLGRRFPTLLAGRALDILPRMTCQPAVAAVAPERGAALALG